MTSTGENPQARPLFRKLALGMAAVCVILGLVSVIVPGENKLLWVGVFLFLGYVMMVIGTTGFWPPRPTR